MEDLLNDEEKAEILAVSKSQELPVATSPLEPLTKTDEKALSHEDIPQSIPDLSQQVGTRSGTQSTISHTSNASLGPLFCPDPEGEFTDAIVCKMKFAMYIFIIF